MNPQDIGKRVGINKYIKIKCLDNILNALRGSLVAPPDIYDVGQNGRYLLIKDYKFKSPDEIIFTFSGFQNLVQIHYNEIEDIISSTVLREYNSRNILFRQKYSKYTNELQSMMEEIL
jgi:hypothetical protein